MQFATPGQVKQTLQAPDLQLDLFRQLPVPVEQGSVCIDPIAGAEPNPAALTTQVGPVITMRILVQ